MIAEKENGTTEYKTTNPTVQKTDQGDESTMHLTPASKKAANTRAPRHAVITALAQALRKRTPSLCLCLTLRIRDKRFHLLSVLSLIETLSRPQL